MGMGIVRAAVLLGAFTAFTAGCAGSDGRVASASDLRLACVNARANPGGSEESYVDKALEAQLDVKVRMRALDRDAIHAKVGNAVFPRDVVLLAVALLDRQQPCCSVRLDVGIEGDGAEWTHASGGEIWSLAGLVAPTPAGLGSGFSVGGLVLDLFVGLLTLGTLDLKQRGEIQVTPGSPGTGTPEQRRALGMVSLLDDLVAGERDLTAYDGWTRQSSLVLGAPSAGAETNATLVLTLSVDLDADAFMKRPCRHQLVQRMALPPGGSTSARLASFLEGHPEFVFGKASAK